MTNPMRTEKEFFAALIANGGASNIFLNSGIKIQGSIISEDEHCILLRSGADSRFAGTSLIMKNAIATVMPTSRGESHRVIERESHGASSINRRE